MKEEGEREGIWESCQQGTQNRKGDAGCLWFGNSERRGLGEEWPVLARAGILLTSSGHREGGDSPGGGWAAMAKGRGSQPFIRALLVHPTMWLFLPYRAGIGEESFLIAGGATSPQGKFVQTRK